ncbi:MAG: type I pullulanase [Turicibacter sp.]|nr:type I pullulanase [Turicibacter sp.]
MTQGRFSAYLEEYNKITILVPKSYSNGEIGPFKLANMASAEVYELKIDEKHDLGHQIKYSLSIQGFVRVGIEYQVIDCYQNKSYLLLGYIARTDEFDKRFYYSGDDLGPTYSKDKTTFKLWAPTATHVQLILYLKDVCHFRSMKRCAKGVWELTIDHDLEGCRYRYEIVNNLIHQETIDPYAIASTANAEYSVVVDPKKCVKVDKSLKPTLEKPTDAIIYEVSIRDFTIDPSSRVNNRGKFLGLTEEMIDERTGQTYGLAYLKELGITHVQLLPIFDFAGVDEEKIESSYNWGYNPVQYNVPEGSYALDPTDPYSRINELRTMINVLHEHGLGVIMDVVYNHVYDRKTFPFDTMVPTYFYRYDYQGMPSDGTGCGNDLATERLMVRKYILDSVKFWIQEYGIDGFRFDLMGILDIDTMNEVRQLCEELDPNILVYGEGWDMNTSLLQSQKAAKFNAFKLPHIGHFNDSFRDSIKGHTFNHQDRGLALGNFGYANTGKQLLAGSSGLVEGETYAFYQPEQSINYIECHDNHTLWDRMQLSNGDEDQEVREKRQILATAMVIFAQGIPFLHCGQEFCRSKNGIENSYNAPDYINAINWEQVYEHKKSIDLIKGYLKIRKSHGAFRFSNSVLVKKHLRIFQHHHSVIEYTLKNVKEYGAWDEIHIFFNTQNYEVNIPIVMNDFTLIADDQESGTESIREVEGELKMPPISTIILVK